MAIEFFTTIQQALFGSTGDYLYVAMGILVLFVVLFLFVGIDFKYAVMFTAPLGIAFSNGGWFNSWVGVVYWLLVVSMGIFTVWQLISER